jgi:HlyD family secretion protein
MSNDKLRPWADSAPRRRRWPLLLLLIVGGVLAWWWLRGDDSAQNPRYRTANVDRRTVRVAISATGSLRARSTVEIGSQISGQIMEVLADYNQRVQRDQVLARLDPATQKARVTLAQADLVSARAAG